MKIFISWSGPKSRQIAKILREWIPTVLTEVEAFYSADDISKGVNWFGDISSELEAAQFGIICLTKDNLCSPWLLFESGALSHNVKKANVCPVLFDIEPSDVSGPLAQFQLTRFDQEDFLRTMTTLNSRLSRVLEEKTLAVLFSKFWPDLEERVQLALSSSQTQDRSTSRSDRELLEELLALTRSHVFSEGPSALKPRMVQDLTDALLSHCKDILQRGQAKSLRELREVRLPLDYFITLVRGESAKELLMQKYQELNELLLSASVSED